MTSLRKIGERSFKSYRNLEKSIGFYRNLIGIYKDHIEIYDELEKDQVTSVKSYRNLEDINRIL